jgi:hypothetical protein
VQFGCSVCEVCSALMSDTVLTAETGPFAGEVGTLLYSLGCSPSRRSIADQVFVLPRPERR